MKAPCSLYSWNVYKKIPSWSKTLRQLYDIPDTILPVVSLPVPDGTYKGFTMVLNPDDDKLCMLIVVSPQKTATGYTYDCIGFADVPLKMFKNYIGVLRGSYKNKTYAAQKAIFANFVNNKLFTEYTLTKYPANDDWLIYGTTYQPIFCMEHKAPIPVLLSRDLFFKPKYQAKTLSQRLMAVRTGSKYCRTATPVANITISEAMLELYIAQANYIVSQALGRVWTMRSLTLPKGTKKFIDKKDYAFFTAHDGMLADKETPADNARPRDCMVNMDIYNHNMPTPYDRQCLSQKTLVTLLNLGYSVTLMK